MRRDVDRRLRGCRLLRGSDSPQRTTRTRRRGVRLEGSQPADSGQTAYQRRQVLQWVVLSGRRRRPSVTVPTSPNFHLKHAPHRHAPLSLLYHPSSSPAFLPSFSFSSPHSFVIVAVNSGLSQSFVELYFSSHSFHRELISPHVLFNTPHTNISTTAEYSRSHIHTSVQETTLSRN